MRSNGVLRPLTVVQPGDWQRARPPRWWRAGWFTFEWQALVFVAFAGGMVLALYHLVKLCHGDLSP